MIVLRVALLISATVLVAQEPSLEALRQEGRWKPCRPRIEGWYQAKPSDPYALLWMSRIRQACGNRRVPWTWPARRPPRMAGIRTIHLYDHFNDAGFDSRGSDRVVFGGGGFDHALFDEASVAS